MIYDRQWHWRKRLGHRKGQPCRILARGALNSALVEFADGFRVITSRHAVRKAPPVKCCGCGEVVNGKKSFRAIGGERICLTCDKEVERAPRGWREFGKNMKSYRAGAGS